MSQVGDIAAALAYQVKKEIAENYFGTRRELEEEREELLAQGQKIQKTWEQEVLATLRMIVSLFPDPEKGRAFLNLVGQEDLPGWTSEASPRVFSEALAACRLPLTFTSKGKYRALIEHLYLLAVERSKQVLERHSTWQKKVALHNEEVVQFGISFNLTEILSFIKALEGADELKGVLGENLDPRAVPELEQKLQMKVIPPGSPGAREPKPLPEFKGIRDGLRALADRSFDQQAGEIKACLRPTDRVP
ncbi:MAG: hypothetical protein HY892_22085 [Deltaproteobacteria bacterium]|nr:hypothetical protein [Deltaproteobacteria bacterium]